MVGGSPEDRTTDAGRVAVVLDHLISRDHGLGAKPSFRAREGPRVLRVQGFLGSNYITLRILGLSMAGVRAIKAISV